MFSKRRPAINYAVFWKLPLTLMQGRLYLFTGGGGEADGFPEQNSVFAIPVISLEAVLPTCWQGI
jgi:hypothetical protein